MAPKALRAAATKSAWRGSGPRGEGSEPMPSTVYREPNRDEEDNLVPACGIAVSVLVGMDMWLTIVALVLLLTRVFWGPA
jgi:hypothetical protein